MLHVVTLQGGASYVRHGVHLLRAGGTRIHPTSYASDCDTEEMGFLLNSAACDRQIVDYLIEPGDCHFHKSLFDLGKNRIFARYKADAVE
jgi:hypothetical protein